MSTVEVKWRLSEESRQSAFVATGKLPAAEQNMVIDAESLTPEDRAALFAVAGPKLAINDYWQFDRAPTPADVLARAAEVAERRRVRAREDAADNLRWALVRLHTAVTEQNPDGLWQQDRASVREAGKLGLDVNEAMDLLRELDGHSAEWRAALAERRARAEAEAQARRDAEFASEQAAKAVAAAEKAAWVAQHGSEHLRRACAAGHSCDRLYWTERAALEYAGYVLDYEKHGDWKERTCPTVAALDERDAVLAAHPAANVNIVWLTAEPRAVKLTDENELYGEPFLEVEAVVVDDPTYTRYLVKSL